MMNSIRPDAIKRQDGWVKIPKAPTTAKQSGRINSLHQRGCTMKTNPWNRLADIFGCPSEEGSIPACAADNICIAWPSVENCIAGVFKEPRHRKALDFGCGGGMFCWRLHELGFDVTGYDKAEDLVKTARNNAPEAITITSSNAIWTQNAQYHLITSIMVLQFIEDIAATASRLLSLLRPGGLIVYAVFNPEFVEDNLNRPPFSGFADHRSGFMELKPGVKIPVFIRRAADYRSLFESLGCEEVYRDYPGFTEAFLRKYDMPFSTTCPEYLIQAFRSATG